MKTTLLTLLLLLFTAGALAQPQNPVYVHAEPQDSIKLSIHFANTDVGLDQRQGIGAELDAKLIRYERFRVGGVFRYDRACFDCDPKVDAYSVGPQISYDVFNGRVSVFGRALFGITTTYQQSDKLFTRTYGAGADVNFGYLFLRPFVMDFIRVEGLPITVNRFGAGGGIRF